jgi:hypothetical protein
MISTRFARNLTYVVRDFVLSYDLYQIYHNYVRPHEALEGKTPAEVCGIEVQGENKRITIIQNASREKSSH